MDLISQGTQGILLMNDRANIGRAACTGNGDVSLVTLQRYQYKTIHCTETELKDLLALKDTTKEHSEEGI